jgi:hypothetical protein
MILIKQLIVGSILVGLLGALLFGQLTAVNAQDFCSTTEGAKTTFCEGQTTENPIIGKNGIISKILRVIIVIVAVTSVIVAIVGGMQLTLSSGDSQRVANARNMIIYGVIGLAIAIFAQVIVAFVLNKL